MTGIEKSSFDMTKTSSNRASLYAAPKIVDANDIYGDDDDKNKLKVDNQVDIRNSASRRLSVIGQADGR